MEKQKEILHINEARAQLITIPKQLAARRAPPKSMQKVIDRYVV
jgi:hypothetical protein